MKAMGHDWVAAVDIADRVDMPVHMVGWMMTCLHAILLDKNRGIEVRRQYSLVDKKWVEVNSRRKPRYKINARGRRFLKKLSS